MQQDQKAILTSNSTEVYILKVMMTRPDSIVEIAQALKANDFFTPCNRYTFGAIKRISLDGDVTPESIMTFLENNQKDGYEAVSAIGGVQALHGLIDETLPPSPSVKSQIEVLKGFSYRRNCLDVADKIRSFATTNIGDFNKQFESIEELDQSIKETTYNLTNSINNHQKIKKIGSKIDAVKKMMQHEGIDGIDISLKYPRFNKINKGLRRGTLTVIGAGEKVGKSTVMLDMCWFVARVLNIPVAYADTEMREEEVLLRLLAKETGISEEVILENKLTEEQQLIIDQAFDTVENTPFFHFNANELTNSELESKVKLLQIQEGIELFAYDYVKIQAHEAEKGRTDLMLAAKIDTLKEKIAKQCNIPVLTSGQMWVDEKGKGKYAETSHFTKLADAVWHLKLNLPTYEDAHQHFGTHYMELMLGRSVKLTDWGKTVDITFGENHRIKEH